MDHLVLYGTALSGHTQRVAALLSMLGLPWRLEPYPRIRAWLDGLEALPGFVPLPPAVEDRR
jgi:glutathione S-transferase